MSLIMMMRVRGASMRRAGGVAGLAVVLALVVAARAADAPAPPCGAGCQPSQSLPSADIVPDVPAGGAVVPPNDPAVQASLPACRLWTDRCVTCQRDAGKVACSNIGLACQPQAVECLEPEPATDKKDGN